MWKILRRGGKNTWKKFTKKVLMAPMTIMVWPLTQSQTSWVPLGSITKNKDIGSDGIPAELFQILKDDVIAVLHSISQKIWKAQQWPEDWKMSVFNPIPKKNDVKESSNYYAIVLISPASKVMLKIL